MIVKTGTNTSEQFRIVFTKMGTYVLLVLPRNFKHELTDLLKIPCVEKLLQKVNTSDP